MEEEFNRRAKEESREALWQKSATRSKAIRVRVGNGRSSSIVLHLQVQEKGVLCRRQLGARGGPLMEMEEVKLVWMQREERGENSTAQRSKSVVKQHTGRRPGKCSQREG